jgi:hypothetical protein
VDEALVDNATIAEVSTFATKENLGVYQNYKSNIFPTSFNFMKVAL